MFGSTNSEEAARLTAKQGSQATADGKARPHYARVTQSEAAPSPYARLRKAAGVKSAFNS